MVSAESALAVAVARGSRPRERQIPGITSGVQLGAVLFPAVESASGALAQPEQFRYRHDLKVAAFQIPQDWP